MLSDLYILEHYYESPHAALFFEDLSRRYGGGAVEAALKAGHIAQRLITHGPQRGRMLLWLTEKGRREAGNMKPV